MREEESVREEESEREEERDDKVKRWNQLDLIVELLCQDMPVCPAA